MAEIEGEEVNLRARLARLEGELRARMSQIERRLAVLSAERVSIATGALPSGMITREAAAEFLGLKKTTLHRWAHRRIGPAFTVWRNKAYYERATLEAWAAENTQSKAGGGRRPAGGAADAPLLAGL